MHRRPATVVVVVLAACTAAAAGPPAAAAPAPVTWTSSPASPPNDPTATAELFRAVAVAPGGDAFAVGAVQFSFAGSAGYGPLIERFDGATWTRMTVPRFEPGSADQQFAGATALAADDVWAVGRGTPTVAPSKRAPWAVHFDGTSWPTVAVPNADPTTDAAMTAVAGRATDDVWAVGDAGVGGAAWHWDGAAWSGGAVRVTGCRSTSPVHLGAVTVTAAGAVLAGGACVTADGAAVAVVARLERPGRFQVVARVASRSGVTDLAAAADGTVWAVGTQRSDTRIRPFLLAGSGSTWTVRFRPARGDGRTEQAYGLAVAPTGVTVVGESDDPSSRAPFAATWTGARWQPAVVTAPGGNGGWLTAVDGTSDGRVVAVGQYPAGRPALLPFSASPPTP